MLSSFFSASKNDREPYGFLLAPPHTFEEDQCEAYLEKHGERVASLERRVCEHIIDKGWARFAIVGGEVVRQAAIQR